MISMSVVQDIRRLRMEGESIASIARNAGVSEPTVRKYLRPRDMSPSLPVKEKRPSVMDRYAGIVDGWLEEDQGNWHKQRHTAKRIWQRLREEHGADLSYNTVQRYVKRWKEDHRRPSECFLDQVAIPADMQVDFGQADFYLRDVRTRLHYLVCDFPFSNVGLAQVFYGETAECVCEGLLAVFGYVGGVPRRIIFDNATGVGRRVCKEISTSELFGRFAAHFGFDYVFCNPNAGHEKGAVENKVGAIRRELFVPLPQIWNLRTFNEKLLARCMARSDKPHYAKGESERQLFCEDAFALLDLPAAEFRAMSFKRMRADKYGNITLDGRHRYSSAPELGGAELIVGKGAFDVEIYDEQGALVVVHERAWGREADRDRGACEPAAASVQEARGLAQLPRARDAARRPQGVDGRDGRRAAQVRVAHHEGCRRRERLRSHGGRHGAGIRARAIAGQGLCAARRIRHMQRSGRDRLRGESGLRCLRCGFLDDGRQPWCLKQLKERLWKTGSEKERGGCACPTTPSAGSWSGPRPVSWMRSRDSWTMSSPCARPTGRVVYCARRRSRR